MRLTRRALAPLLALTLLTNCATLGGAGVMAAITKILTVVTNAQQVLAVVDAAARVFFDVNRESPLRPKYLEAYGKASASLETVTRLLHGTEKLNNEQIDAAFADFKAAYLSLTSILNQIGIAQAGSGGDGPLKLRTGPTVAMAEVPPPLALSFSAKDASK